MSDGWTAYANLDHFSDGMGELFNIKLIITT